jgi:hypothetical protein
MRVPLTTGILIDRRCAASIDALTLRDWLIASPHSGDHRPSFRAKAGTARLPARAVHGRAAPDCGHPG